MSRPPAHHILFYDYVEDILERRGPLREQHLQQIWKQKDAGRIVMAGALGDPVTAGAMIFAGATPAEIERFVSADPYVRGGLVADWRIEPWAVV